MPEDPYELKPFRPRTGDPAEYWLWHVHVFDVMEHFLPSGEDPQEIHWDHPDEDWKEEAEAFALERLHCAATDQALRTFLDSWQWPKVNAAVPFYAQKRLKFARQQAGLFATKSSDTGASLFAIPAATRKQTTLWLLNDLYKAKNRLASYAGLRVKGG